MKEDVCEWLKEVVRKMGRSDLKRFTKYLMTYGADKRTKESSRAFFFAVIEAADEALNALPEEEVAEQAGATSNETDGSNGNKKLVPQNPADLNGNSNEITHYLMNEILSLEAAKGGQNQNQSSDSDSEDCTNSSQEAEPVISDHVPSIFYRQRPEETDPVLESSAQNSNKGSSNWAANLMAEANNFADLYEDEEEEDVDEDYGGSIEEEEEEDDNMEEEDDLDFESLQARLPPYALLNRKKKKKFFRDLTEEFVRKIKVRTSKKRIRKVNFNVKANQVVTFYKDAKINK